jgi:parallel beta-helix repeat protein
MARISTYDPSGPLTGNEDLLGNQDGKTVRISPKRILDYANGSILRGKITKTISNTYGDFYSFDEMFEWLSRTPMISVDLIILLQPGTYDITNDTSAPALYTVIGSQLTSLTIRGVSRDSCILNSNNSLASKGFLKIKNMSLTFEQLTVTNSGQASFMADATSSLVTMDDIIIDDVEYTIRARSSNILVSDCMISYSGVGIYLENSSTLEVSGGIMDGNGTALAGIHANSSCTITGRDTFTVRNSQYGLFLTNGCKAIMESHVFSGNTQDFSIPFNVFQGDGGYATDGNLNIGGDSSFYEKTSNKGVPSGYASLDVDGKVPASQLPAFADDVLQFDTVGDFPAVGETAKLYIDDENGSLHRWTGTEYILAPIIINAGDF